MNNNINDLDFKKECVNYYSTNIEYFVRLWLNKEASFLNLTQELKNSIAELWQRKIKTKC